MKSDSKKKKKSDGGVSIADLISIIGVVGCGILFSIGIAYWTFNMVLAVVAGCLMAIILGVLLYGAVHFKQKDASVKSWKGYEIAMVALMLVLGAVCIAPISYFTGIQSDKTNLQQVADKDITSIREGIANFQNAEKNNLENTCRMVKDALSGSRSAELQQFIDANSLTSAQEVDNYYALQEELINTIGVRNAQGGGAAAYFSGWDQSLTQAQGYVNSWNLFRLPIGIKEIEDVNVQATGVLAELNTQLTYPLIMREGTFYVIKEQAQPVPQYAEQLEFRQALKDVPKFGGKGLIITLAVFVVVFFKYLVAPRSLRVGISRNKQNEDGGQWL